MPFCPKCGSEVKKDLAVCPNCGQGLKLQVSLVPSWPSRPSSPGRNTHTSRNGAIVIVAVLILIILFIIVTG